MKPFKTFLLELSSKESFAFLGTLVYFLLLDKEYHENIFSFLLFYQKFENKFTI